MWAIGVAEPGHPPTLDMAASHHRQPWSQPAARAGGGAIVGYVAPAAFWAAPPLVAGGVAVLAAAAGGADGYLVTKRGRQLQNGSRLVGPDDRAFDALLVLGMIIGQIRGGIDRYDQQMAQDSKRKAATDPARFDDEPAGHRGRAAPQHVGSGHRPIVGSVRRGDR